MKPIAPISKEPERSAVYNLLRALVFVVAIAVAWSGSILIRWIRGDDNANTKRAADSELVGFHIREVFADAPGGGVTSTPFLAVWNGNEYRIENDVLFGKPRSHFATFDEGDTEYRAGRVAPDLYHIQSPVVAENKKFRLQIQEIEPEESYIDRVALFKVIHSKSAEAIVRSDYKSFHFFEKEELAKKIKLPTGITARTKADGDILRGNSYWQTANELPMNRNEVVDVRFTGFTQVQNVALLIKSRSRTWVMGQEMQQRTNWSDIARNLTGTFALRSYMIASFFLSLWLMKRGALALPLIALTGTGGAGACSSGGSGGGGGGGAGGTGGGGAGGTGSTSGASATGPGSSACSATSGPGGGKCFMISYADAAGGFINIDTVEPRAWKTSADLVEIPREAVNENGELKIRISATERHFLSFVGALVNAAESKSEVQNLKLVHTSVAKTSSTQGNTKTQYLHTIPGDVVDLEFEAPEGKLNSDEQESFFFRSSGFYTKLSVESRKRASNWPERVSDEAKQRLALLGVTSS